MISTEVLRQKLSMRIFFRIFVEALVEGGIGFFDELRGYFEAVGINFKEKAFINQKLLKREKLYKQKSKRRYK